MAHVIAQEWPVTEDRYRLGDFEYVVARESAEPIRRDLSLEFSAEDLSPCCGLSEVVRLSLLLHSSIKGSEVMLYQSSCGTSMVIMLLRLAMWERRKLL